MSSFLKIIASDPNILENKYFNLWNTEESVTRLTTVLGALLVIERIGGAVRWQ